MKKYDVIVIGGGIAGYEFSVRAADSGMRVALVEKEDIGGTCLHVGCIPSKIYVAFAARFQNINPSSGINYLPELVEEQVHVREILQKGMEENLRRSGVDVVYGEPTIDLRKDEIHVASEGWEAIGADVVLATGTVPKKLQINGIDREIEAGFIRTNENIFSLREMPKTFVILGAGVSGVEMAYAFSRLGSHVVLLEREDSILPRMDLDIVQSVRQMLNEAEVEIYVGVEVKEVCEETVYFIDEKMRNHIVECECVYASIGREVPIHAPHLEGIARDSHGFITVDPQYRTSMDHVYAIGDMIGGSLQAHSAINHANRLVGILKGLTWVENTVPVPQTIYLHPECVQVGFSENHLKKEGRTYNFQKISMNCNGRFVAENGGISRSGFIKLIFDETHVLLGASLVCNHAVELSIALEILIQEKKSWNEILQYFYPHPAEGEIIRMCAYEYGKRHKLS